jgi:anti-anti-sigma factor
MEIGIKDLHGYKFITVSGQISQLKDSISLKSLINTLLEEKIDKIALSLGQMDYIDSSAINVLIYTKGQVEKTGGEFYIIEPNEYIMDVISVVGLKDYFKILPDKNSLKGK